MLQKTSHTLDVLLRNQLREPCFGEQGFCFFRTPDRCQKTQVLLECPSDPAEKHDF